MKFSGAGKSFILSVLGTMSQSDKSKIKQLTKDVEGFLTNKDGSLLFNLSKKVKGSGVIVEIGSWKGKSTIWLAKGSKKGNGIKVYAVDHHMGSPEHKSSLGELWTFEEFKANIDRADVVDIVIPIVETSADASRDFDDPIELLFIDGAHDYHSVKSDYDEWSHKVVDGGIIAFHDSEFHGVSDFLWKLINKEKNINFIDFGGSIACIRRTDRISKFGFVRNKQIVKTIKFRGEVGWKRKNASALSKPFYNLVRNLAKLYRSLLLRIG